MDFFQFANTSSSFVRLPSMSSISNTLYHDNMSRYMFDMIYNEFSALTSNNTGTSVVVSPEDMNIRMHLSPLFSSTTSTNTSTSTNTNPSSQFFFEFQSLPAIAWMTTSSFEVSVPEVHDALSIDDIAQISEKVLITEPTDCYICLDTLLPNSCMRQLNTCHHKFCIYCIDPWLKHHPTCPTCKKQVKQ